MSLIGDYGKLPERLSTRKPSLVRNNPDTFHCIICATTFIPLDRAVFWTMQENNCRGKTVCSRLYAGVSDKCSDT